ncbi:MULTISPECIES: hypothetical protein [unclassified Roseburia]|uniref:hypothetical protein n=1 Tax=unclassified Roseburia TaxID=2637578 RepID=UPI000E4FCB54|nr:MULTISPECIES: hypothetical protein [unclassified Roseburia]RGI50110.1 hypothetical protein DXB39_02075 [Roseburia sp. OM03-7AC]RGI53593.1 hypothetical protein DXB35_04355 [Roseburia sp. OM03-18]
MSGKTEKLQWHPAFCAATELELRQDLDVLELIPEYNLSKKPLQIDLVIIKKMDWKRTLQNEIGHIMRGHNILEYKGPGDELTIDSFFKVIGYASLYKAQGIAVNKIPASEVTVSFFRNAYPKALFQELKKEGYILKKMYPGIYYVRGKVPFPVQVVVTSQLERKAHCSLRVLTTQVEMQDAELFLEQIHYLESKNERSNIDSVLQVSVNANKQVYSLLRRQNEMCEALRELMKDEIEKELENKLEQGEKLQLIRQVIKKLQKGNSVEETADMLEEEPENIRKIYEIAATMAPDYDVEKIYKKL